MAPECPVVPLHSACRSSSITCPSPCFARWYAMLAPITPPPIMMISAVSLISKFSFIFNCVKVAGHAPLCPATLTQLIAFHQLNRQKYKLQENETTWNIYQRMHVMYFECPNKR